MNTIKKSLSNSNYPENYVMQLSLAGKKIEINCLTPELFKVCSNYLIKTKSPDVTLHISPEEIAAERKIIGYYRSGNTTCIKTVSDVTTENLLILRKIADTMLQFDTFLMHGSVIALDNQAYMFTAPSGVGKTTRTKMWLDSYPDSIVVNGDKPLIKITDSEILACGTPWSGKERWNTNIMVPLRAIFLLERSEDEEKSTIQEIPFGKAFPFLFQQTYRPNNPSLMRKVLRLLQLLDGRVKIYKFHSAPNLEAIKLAHDTAQP